MSASESPSVSLSISPSVSPSVSPSSGFDPGDVAGLVVWLKADSIGGSDNDAVATWSDDSGSGNHVTQATGSAQPTYKTGIVNGHAVVRFDGGDYLNRASFTGGDLAQPNTIFVVSKFSATAGSQHIVDSAISTATKRNVIYNNSGAGNKLAIYAGTILNSNTGNDTSWHIFTALYNGASSNLRRDGTQIISGDAGTQAMGSIVVGGYNGLTAFYTGDIAEVLIYDSEVSDGDRDSIETYLGTLYGITVASPSISPSASVSRSVSPSVSPSVSSSISPSASISLSISPSVSPSISPSPSVSPSESPSVSISVSPSVSPSGVGESESVSPSVSPSYSISPSASPSPSIGVTGGDVCWGHDTGVLEDNVRDFSGNWYGTGAISGSGDGEQICLEAGEYMISEIVETGDQIIQLIQNNYAAGDDVIMKYRTGATPTACFEAAWTTYSTPFISLGYTQVKLESTVGNLELSASADGHYFVDGTNTPFLLIGDSPQGMLVSLTPANMDTYLSNRQGYGVNAIQVMLIGDSTYTGGNDTTFETVDGIKPFSTNGDISTPNDTYFARVETLLDKADSYGMIVMLNIDAYSANERALWKNNGVTKCTNFGAYLGNRFKNFPNIIWSYGCDYTVTTDADLDNCLYAVRDGIASQDSNHMHTMWPYIDLPSRLSNWENRVNCDFIYCYSTPYHLTFEEYSLASKKPAFLGESYYEDASGSTPLRMRKQAYYAMFSGACGHFYDTGLYSWHFEAGWASYLDSYPGMTHVTTHLKALLTGKAWYDLVPDITAHDVLTAGYGTYANYGDIDDNDFAPCTMTADGSLALIYIPTDRDITVDMSEFSGTVTCRWFDPTDGTYTTDAASPLANSGSHVFDPTSYVSTDGDVVLVLEA